MSWLKSLFKKDLQPISFSVLGCDIHSHLIAGIDDGSPDVETSVSIIKNMIELGYKKAITTPHIMSDFYRNNPTNIKQGLELVRQELKNQSIDFRNLLIVIINYRPKTTIRKIFNFRNSLRMSK